MKWKPDVSVVMSVFNGEKALSETVDSILAQEGVDLELIAVVDGSEDDSGAILDGYAKLDSRVRVYHREHRGLTRSLIFGCGEACGSYIARHDVADTSDPSRLKAQAETLRADSDLVFVSCWTKFTGPLGEPLYEARGSGAAATPIAILSEEAPRLLLDGPTHHGSVMMRRDSYEQAGGYRREFFYGQDWDLWYRLAELGKFQTVGRFLYTARVVPEGISSLNSADQGRIGELQLAAARLRRAGLSEAPALERARVIRPAGTTRSSRRRLADGYFFIGSCLAGNRDPAALTYLRKSLMLDPFQPERWIRLVWALGWRLVAGIRR